MKKLIAAGIAVLAVSCAYAQWKPAGEAIKTEWAEQVNPDNVLPEYPRPIMERDAWENLNGLWDYAIRPANEGVPANFDGKILVPFAVESSLSGVMKPLGKDNALWYKRTFEIPQGWSGKNILLNFGAVDWSAEVWVNGKEVGRHTGGFTPFGFDITGELKSGENTLVVKVLDACDQSYQPRGKQTFHPGGIFYTSVSGIWQTVWLEPVSKDHIVAVKTTPDFDSSKFKINAISTDADAKVEISVLDGDKVIAKRNGQANKDISVKISDAKPWSPDSPFLYDLKIDLIKNGEVVDTVKSYAAMRKFSMKEDNDGWKRLQLNNKDLFQFGPLDQGWWPDGLYTAPTDEALKYDIQKTKDLGFNMIRKHVKVEPARWYTHCDRLGIIVWQDMPSAFEGHNNWDADYYYDAEEFPRSEAFENNFRKEWVEIIEYLYSYPCISVWVPFNEAWGQFKTAEIVDLTREADPTRLINAASGGNFYKGVGDITDSHSYPAPRLRLIDPKQANVCGEYGGIGLAMDGHLWFKDNNWGYVQFKTSEEVTNEYVKFANILLNMARNYALTGAVYTQTTDVEGEVNGLITYDRKKIKVDETRVRDINQTVVHSLSEK